MTSVEELLSKYIQNTEQVLAEIKLPRETVCVERERSSSVADLANSYLQDAKHYRDKEKFVTGLACIAYGEGLLDALRLLDIAEFRWATKKGDADRMSKT